MSLDTPFLTPGYRMTIVEWLGLAGVCLAGAASPGPSLAVILSAVMRGGRSSGLAAAWAHACGVGIYAALTVFGITAMIAYLPWLFQGLQIVGAIYLLWLALGLLTSPAAQGEPYDPGDAQVHQRGAAARNGFAVAFLNPKLAVFMLALFSQFVRPESGSGTAAVMIGTATCIDGLWYTLVTLLVSRAGWLKALQRRAGLIDRVLGVLLGIVAITILALALGASV